MESVATRSEGELVIYIVRKEGLDHGPPFPMGENQPQVARSSDPWEREREERKEVAVGTRLALVN